MKLKDKLLVLLLIYIAGIALISGLSALGWWRTARLQDSINLGETLQLKSRNVQSLMKDLVFDLFAPRIYGQLRSLTYSPRTGATMRQWQQAVEEYRETFRQFMDLDYIARNRDSFIRDQYRTAVTMNARAMEMLARMETTLLFLQERYRSSENPYNEMQKDESLIPFFNEFQDTSYYFSNSFEGFMNHFIRTLTEAAGLLRFRMYMAYIMAAVLIILIYIFLAFFVVRQFQAQLLHMEQAFRRVSHGDFSARLSIQTRDELGEMAQRFNLLIAELKNNVSSILTLTRDISGCIGQRTTYAGMGALICRAGVQDSQADTVLLLKSDGGSSFVPEHFEGRELSPAEAASLIRFLSLRVFRSGEHLFIKDTEGMEEFSSIGSLIAVPLIMEGNLYGLLVSLKDSGAEKFSDLGVIRFATFSEYAALAMDNFFAYSELLENREARYLALRSQLQPHFIYNVLNGFIGLNRKDDRTGLEQAILALKDMLRYAQENQNFVPLEEEILFLEKYCELQKIRFSDRFAYRFFLDPEVRSVAIPRLFLQPLVENAIIHGIEPLERIGTLEVSCTPRRGKDGPGVDIFVRDDGRGFDPEIPDTREHIGLGNFRQRMLLAFPEGSWSINSRPGEGCVVEIHI